MPFVLIFARRDDFHATQPEGRKIVAQCASTGRKAVPPQPRDGAEEPTQRSLLTPRPGATHPARLQPTAVRRGLLSFALRALRAAPFADCPYAASRLRAAQGTGH